MPQTTAPQPPLPADGSSAAGPPALPLDYESRAPRPAREARGLERFRGRWFALLGALAAALYLCWLMLEPFVDVLLWAAVLAVVFYPVHQQVVRRSGWRPGIAALLSCILAVVVILVPVIFISVAIVDQATDAAGELQSGAGRLLDPESRAYKFVNRYVAVDQIISRQALAALLRAAGAAVAGRTFTIAGGVVVVILKIIFVLITLYYLLRDRDRVLEALLDGLPLERAQTQRIFDRTREVIAASVYGVLVIASAQALLGAMAFWALGLPSPLLWSVMLFFLSMIPVGSFLVWVPASIFLALRGDPVRAIILAAWCGAVFSAIDYVFRPRLVGKRTRMHELLVFFSVLGGLQLFGPLGLVVGPVVVAIALALLDIFRKAERVADDKVTR
jgi:predicted PurR-regulated permease PerM